MKEEKVNKKPIAEDAADLKKEPAKKDGVKKGYNEKNPTQPQGAFPADNQKDKA
ncbi:MAG: hypothetical protein JWQ27_896 [Ferruginibacter sp.]|nr:hypothetical protein [Ferruginibacter sp.]